MREMRSEWNHPYAAQVENLEAVRAKALELLNSNGVDPRDATSSLGTNEWFVDRRVLCELYDLLKLPRRHER